MRILLALSPTRDNEEAIKRAIESINGGSLYVVYILDDRYPEAVSSWLLYLGFMGEAVTEDIGNVIKDELRIRANERLEEIKEILESKNVKGIFKILEGPFFEVLEKEYAKNSPDKVIIPVEKPDIFGTREKIPDLKFDHEFV